MTAKKRATRRLIIDVQVPDASGFRYTVKGDDRTVKPEALDKWIPIAEQIIALVTKHVLEVRSGVAPSSERSGTP